MASLDDIINITEERAEIVLETNETYNSRDVLFTYDETKLTIIYAHLFKDILIIFEHYFSGNNTLF